MPSTTDSFRPPSRARTTMTALLRRQRQMR